MNVHLGGWVGGVGGVQRTSGQGVGWSGGGWEAIPLLVIPLHGPDGKFKEPVLCYSKQPRTESLFHVFTPYPGGGFKELDERELEEARRRRRERSDRDE